MLQPLTIGSGPNWIHGTCGNPIVPLADLAHSKLGAFGETSPMFDPQGNQLEQPEADKLQGLLWQAVEEATAYSKFHTDEIPADKSFYDFCVEKAEDYFNGSCMSSEESLLIQNGEGWTSKKPTFDGSKNGSGSPRIRWKGQEQRKKLWLDMVHMWGTFIGSSVDRQSLKFFLLEEPVEGPNLLVASTYKPLIDLLAGPVQEAGVLNLSTPITSVTTTDPLLPGQKRMLLTSTDRNFSVDSLIVTAPLGCLKKNTIKFNPPLPERIQQSISSLSYGQLEKVYIRFPRAYWAEHKKVRCTCS